MTTSPDAAAEMMGGEKALTRGDRRSAVAGAAILLIALATCVLIPSSLARFNRIAGLPATTADGFYKQMYLRLDSILAGVFAGAYLLTPAGAAGVRWLRPRWRNAYTYAALAGVCVFTWVFLVHFGRWQLDGWDFGIAIDLGWRQILGQRPYVDFPTTTPPGFHLGIKYAFELFGVSWDANLYFAALFACATLLWIYWAMTWLKMGRLASLTVAFAVECAAMLTHCFWSYNDSTLILAAVFLLSCLAYAREPERAGVQVSYLASLTLLSLMKPNIAGLMIAGGVLLLFVATRRKLRLAMLTLGAVVAALAVLALNHVSVRAMITSYLSVHRWAFDGTAPSTGFHLIWGYYIALIYRVAPNISFHQVFTVLFFTGSVLMALGLALTSLLAIRRIGRFALLGPIAVFFGYWGLNQPNYLMESSLVVFFVSLTLYLIFGRDKALTRRVLICAFVVGVLGMLSRSDFGLMPLVCFVALAIESPLRRKLRGGLGKEWPHEGSARRAVAACVLAGSVLGLGLVAGHTYLVSGRFVQSSAREKRHWSQLQGDPKKNSLIFTAKMLRPSLPPSPLPPDVARRQSRKDGALLLLLFGLAVVGAATARDRTETRLVLVAASLVVVVGYMYLYRYDSQALQPWYFANFMIPCALLSGAAVSIPGVPWKALSVAWILLWLYVSAHVWLEANWIENVGFYEGGNYIARHPEIKPVGAWNAGMAGFYGNGGVVNLDGLVNDDIPDYSLANNLEKYLLQRHITHIVDDTVMLHVAAGQRRGGYIGLTRCVTSEVRIWWVPVFVNGGDQVTVSELNPACLGTAAH